MGEHIDDRLVDRAGGNTQPERPISARGALTRRYEIGPNTPMVDSEPATSAPKSRHDLIGDQQDATLVTHPRDRGPVVVGRHDRSEGRATHRFRDEGRHSLGTHSIDRLGQRLSVLHAAASVAQWVHRRHPLGLTEPRLVARSKSQPVGGV